MDKRFVAAALALLLVGCTPDPVPTSPTPDPPTPTPSASATATPTAPEPTPSPEESPSPWGDDRLPHSHVVEGPLTEADNAAGVVTALHEAAAGLPVLKLDVTTSQATLTALTPDEGVVSYRWSDNIIDATTTDFEYLGQATFQPGDYPLESIGRMFDVADLRGVHGDPIYQIQEYREGVVLQTVSSLPETATVFFLPDGTAVPLLGVTSAVDVADGFAAVTHELPEIHRFGFNAERGYWATFPSGEETRTRTRTGGVPVYETPATEMDVPPAFDPTIIEPAVISMVLTRHRSEPEQACEVIIDLSLGRSAPVMAVTCDGETFYSDLAGRDMTDLIG